MQLLWFSNPQVIVSRMQGFKNQQTEFDNRQSDAMEEELAEGDMASAQVCVENKSL